MGGGSLAVSEDDGQRDGDHYEQRNDTHIEQHGKSLGLGRLTGQAFWNQLIVEWPGWFGILPVGRAKHSAIDIQQALVFL